jgi:hypothetical protein
MKTSLRDIKSLVQSGIAADITTAPEEVLPKRTVCIAHSVGSCGITGCVVQDTDSGKLYAVTARSTNLFRML